MTPRERATQLRDKINREHICVSTPDKEARAWVDAGAIDDIAAALEDAERSHTSVVPDIHASCQRQHEINTEATQRSYGLIREALGLPLGEALINGAERVRKERDERPTAWAYQQACAALEKHRQRADDAEKRANLWMVAMSAWKKWGGMSTRECSAEDFRVALERAIHAEDAALAIPPASVSLDNHKETK